RSDASRARSCHAAHGDDDVSRAPESGARGDHYNAGTRHLTKKRFGQHFLHDPGILRRIVQAIAPERGQTVIEIGPGDGALTLPLLRELGRLTVLELDRDLVPRLRAAAAGVGELEIINADVLTVDFSALAVAGKLRIVGNL